MAELIEQPASELYTQPGARDTVVRYYGDVEGFEAEAAAGWRC